MGLCEEPNSRTIISRRVRAETRETEGATERETKASEGESMWREMIEESKKMKEEQMENDSAEKEEEVVDVKEKAAMVNAKFSPQKMNMSEQVRPFVKGDL